MVNKVIAKKHRHCEERGDEAIQEQEFNPLETFLKSTTGLLHPALCRAPNYGKASILSFRVGIYAVFLLIISSSCYSQILNQLNDNKDDSPIIIEAEESVVCDETAQKCVATGLASAQKGTSTVYGDILTVYFTDKGKKREITAMTADGHVRMKTPTETAYGDHAHYDVALNRIILTGGDLKIVTQKEILTARDSLEYYHSENNEASKGIARGNALAQFPEKQQLIQADTLVAYFKPASEKKEQKEQQQDKENVVLEQVEAEENILASEEKRDAKENIALERVEAEGNILASGPKGIVTGDRGVYLEKTKTVEVFNNVKITQDKNVIEGEYAKFNLDTNVAEMYTQPPHISQEKPSKRISGIIMPKSAKKMKEQEGNSNNKITNKSKDRHKLF